MRRSDEHHVAKATLDQSNASENERAHDDVTQLAVRLEETQQVGSIELNHLAIFHRADDGQRATAGKQVRFASELSNASHGEAIRA